MRGLQSIRHFPTSQPEKICLIDYNIKTDSNSSQFCHGSRNLAQDIKFKTPPKNIPQQHSTRSKIIIFVVIIVGSSLLSPKSFLLNSSMILPLRTTYNSNCKYSIGLILVCSLIYILIVSLFRTCPISKIQRFGCLMMVDGRYQRLLESDSDSGVM